MRVLAALKRLPDEKKASPSKSLDSRVMGRAQFLRLCAGSAVAASLVMVGKAPVFAAEEHQLKANTDHLSKRTAMEGQNTIRRPDLAGIRIKSPNQPAVFLVDDDGTRRWIPDPPTYNNLFRGWDGIVQDINTFEIDEGPSITSGAILARGMNSPAIYLISNGLKRWIVSPAAMDKFYFDWGRVQVVSPVLLDHIPSGPNIF